MMEETNNTYPTLFKKIICERDLSYNIVSRVTGLSKTSIYNYAMGLRIPDLKTTFHIMDTMNIEYFLIKDLFRPTD